MTTNLIEMRDYCRMTRDGKWSQGQLIKRIKTMVRQYNTSADSDDDVAKFIIESFAINGVISTYNDTGMCGFTSIIKQMIQHEIYERRVVND